MKRKNAKLHKFDVPIDVDMFFAIANAIAKTEHMLFAFMNTGDERYLEFALDDRLNRGKMMKELITNNRHSVWCWEKHTFAVFYHLLECAEKEFRLNNIEKAKRLLKLAKKEYDKFWAMQKLGEVNK